MKKRSRKSGMRKKKTIDRHAVQELDLFMENTGELYNQKKSILANVKRKRKSGKYDATKAPKLWAYWVNSGVKQYKKEFPGAEFDKPTRDALAQDLAKRYSKGEE
jgi:hypothetical protein